MLTYDLSTMMMIKKQNYQFFCFPTLKFRYVICIYRTNMCVQFIFEIMHHTVVET